MSTGSLTHGSSQEESNAPVAEVDEAVLVVHVGSSRAVLAEAQHARGAVREHRHVHLAGKQKGTALRQNWLLFAFDRR